MKHHRLTLRQGLFSTLLGFVCTALTSCAFVNEKVSKDIASTISLSAPASIDDGTVTNELTVTPTITWTAVAGATSYELAIGSSHGGTEVLSWTDVGNVTTYSNSSLSLTEGNTYYVSVRAKNSVLTSSTQNGDGFTVTLTYPRWVQEAYIKASNADANDNFGLFISLSGDTLASNSWTEDSNETTITNGTTASANNAATSSGAAYIYSRTGTTWVQQAYVKASNTDGGDAFGSYIALDGETVVVGANSEDSNETTITNGTTSSADNTAVNSGAVYIYKRTGTTWAQQAYIKASNADNNDNFGSLVAIDRDTVVVSATYEDSNETTITNGTTASADNSNTMSGAVYVYKRTGNNWAQQAYVKASNSGSGDQFGYAISIYDDTLAVCALTEESNETTITNGATSSADNSNVSAGAVYVYKRTGNNWAQQAYIKAANNHASYNFGNRLSLFADTLAVTVNDSSNQTTITNGTTASNDTSAVASGGVLVYTRSGVSWSQQAYIKAPNSQAGDNFGVSVSVYGDTLAVGAYQEDSNQTSITNGSTASSNNSASAAGAVYVFKRTGTTWAQEAYIKAANADANDYFGFTSSLNDDTLAVGAFQESSNQTSITNGTTASSNNALTASGAVYVYKRKLTATPNWSQQAYIKASNGDAGDSFGGVVALDRDTLVVGAAFEDSNETTITNGTLASADNSAANSGALYVYKRSGTSWAQEAYIKAANAEAGDIYGTVLSIDNDTIVVGLNNENSNETTITNGTTASADNSAASSGALYVYKRTGTSWAQQAYIKAANADIGDQFGYSVDISNDTIVAGAIWESSNETTITNGATASADNSTMFSGAVYVYKRTGNNWAQQAYIKAANNGMSDNLGISTAIDGDTIVAGAIGEDSNETTITNGTTASANNAAGASGAVYVYKRTGNNWAQQAYIKAANSEMNDNFGTYTAIDRDTILVGSREDSNETTITNGTTASADNSAASAGAVYVYKRTGNSWAQEAYIKAANADAGDSFGSKFSIFRDTISVGVNVEASNETTITNGATASIDNSAAGAGAVYVYKRTGNSWAQEAYIKAVNAEAGDAFGDSVSLSGDTLAVGAYLEDSNQTSITNESTASSNNGAAGSGAVYIYIRNYP